MSTRANIIIKDSYDKLFFYRHSDGYPECTMDSLNIFMDWLKKGKIRNSVSQGSGWLIILGAMEYNTMPEFKLLEPHFEGGHKYGDRDSIGSPNDWKCGAYEPTTGIHGDIEFLYIIDMDAITIKCYDTWTAKGEGKHEVSLKKYAAA